MDDVRWFIAHGGATGFNLKVAKHGGIAAIREIHALAAAHGLRCQLGANVGETSLLGAAGRIAAGLCEPLVAHEGAYAGILLEHDVVEPSLGFTAGGAAEIEPLLALPGLGPTIEPRLIARATGTTSS